MKTKNKMNVAKLPINNVKRSAETENSILQCISYNKDPNINIIMVESKKFPHFDVKEEGRQDENTQKRQTTRHNVTISPIRRL